MLTIRSTPAALSAQQQRPQVTATAALARAAPSTPLTPPTAKSARRTRRARSCRCRFLPAWLAAAATGGGNTASSPASPPTPQQQHQQQMPDAEYEALLEKGRADTLDAPTGQLYGRAGRRCTLEDGERYLIRATSARPKDLRARVLLLRNLMRQAMGREREVPGLALQALREAVDADGVGTSENNNNLHACSSDLLEDPSCMPALQLVLLALKALHAQQPPREVLDAAAKAAAAATSNGGDSNNTIVTDPSSTVVDEWRARRLRAFVEAAGDVVPGLANEFAQVERRLRRQLAGLGSEDARLRALVSREWLSAVDLAPPCGVVG